MHGYQIVGELEDLVAGGRYNGAQIYQGLRWLADQGLVVAAMPEPGLSRDRRPFSITAQGTREFDRWLREPLALARPLRDEALIKFVFLGLENPVRLVRFLERLRRQHLRRLAGSQTKPPPEARNGSDGVEKALLSDLSRSALRFREEAEIHWIEYSLLRLRPYLETQVDASEDEVRQDEPSARARPAPS